MKSAKSTTAIRPNGLLAKAVAIKAIVSLETAPESYEPLQKATPPPPGEIYIEIISELSSFAKHLVEPNLNWFNDDKQRAEELGNMLLPGRQGTSLRLADHLVVQYSREHVIMLQNAGSVPTELWLDYRRVLAGTGKKYFDVFKRKNAIKARLFGQEIDTTVGQIVFLCWYSKRGLTEYMKKHEQEVRSHMQQNEKKSRKTAKKTKKRKSRAPSRSECVKPMTKKFIGTFKMWS